MLCGFRSKTQRHTAANTSPTNPNRNPYTAESSKTSGSILGGPTITIDHAHMLSAAIPNQIEERIGKTFLAVLSTAPAIARPIPASPIAPSQPKKLSKIGGLLSSKTGNGAGNKNPMNANRESANQRKNAPAKPANMIPTMGAHLLIRLFT